MNFLGGIFFTRKNPHLKVFFKLPHASAFPSLPYTCTVENGIILLNNCDVRSLQYIISTYNAWLTQGGPAVCASTHLCRCPGGPLVGVAPAGLGLIPWETLPMGENIGRAGGRKPRNCGLRTDSQNRRGLTPPVEGRVQTPRARPREYAI